MQRHGDRDGENAKGGRAGAMRVLFCVVVAVLIGGVFWCAVLLALMASGFRQSPLADRREQHTTILHAIQAYRAANNRYPRSLQQVIEDGYLRSTYSEGVKYLQPLEGLSSGAIMLYDSAAFFDADLNGMAIVVTRTNGAIIPIRDRGAEARRLWRGVLTHTTAYRRWRSLTEAEGYRGTSPRSSDVPEQDDDVPVGTYELLPGMSVEVIMARAPLHLAGHKIVLYDAPPTPQGWVKAEDPPMDQWRLVTDQRGGTHLVCAEAISD